MNSIPKTSTLSPLEGELLKAIAEFDKRLTRLETSLKADSTTAQSQREDIIKRLDALRKRLESLEQSLPALKSLPDLFKAFQKQSEDLGTLCAEQAANYNKAIHVFREMQGIWQAQIAEYQVLKSQVERLTEELRSLGA